MNQADFLLALDHSMIERFMVESNKIEGEEGLNPNDLGAAISFLSMLMTRQSLLRCHGKLAKHLDVDWGGRYRTCDVQVGRYVAPPFQVVPGLMATYLRELPKLDTWEAHNRFEKIHPFQDLNGRMGRLIWLHKARDEGYIGRLSFLHAYYYQTLSHV